MRLIWIPILLIVASLSWAGLSLSEHLKTTAEADQLRVLGGDLSKIRQRNLEQSNVDVAGELIRLSNTSRSFQVNSRAVKSVDQLLQSSLNLIG